MNVRDLTVNQIKNLTLAQVEAESTDDRHYFEQEASEEKYRAWYKIDNLRYNKPSIAMDNVILAFDKESSQLKTLLIKRKNRPFKDSFALPGGFMQENEALEDTVIREVEEETNIKLTSNQFEQLETLSSPIRDYRGHVLSTSYITYLPKITDSIAGSDALSTMWATLIVKNDKISLILDNKELNIPFILSNDEVYARLSNYYDSLITDKHASLPILSFDHDLIICHAIKRIRNKLEYQPNALNLIGDSFTLNEARQLFKCFNVGKPSTMVNNSNFYKKYKDIIIPTGNDIINKTKPEKLFKIK